MILTGNVRLGADAEFATSANGKDYAKFSAAFNTGYGENQTATWIRCTVFGASAERASQLTKGQQIWICGRPSLRNYESASGGGTSLDVVVTEWLYAEKREGGDTQRQPVSPRNNTRQQPQRQTLSDDDIPF